MTHEDSLGNRGRVEAGDVQVMSAGSGIRHAEFNAEPVPLRLFQIWLDPRGPGGAPRWASCRFPASERGGRFTVLASGDPTDAGALPINSEARVLGATLKTGERLAQELAPGRRGYLVTTGPIRLNGLELGARDGAAIDGIAHLDVLARAAAELVLVEFL